MTYLQNNDGTISIKNKSNNDFFIFKTYDKESIIRFLDIALEYLEEDFQKDTIRDYEEGEQDCDCSEDYNQGYQDAKEEYENKDQITGGGIQK